MTVSFRSTNKVVHGKRPVNLYCIVAHRAEERETSSAVHSDCFCEFVFDCNLTQLVDGSTHCKGNCLDLILSNTPDSVGSISISPHSLIQSDHYLLSLTLSVRNHSSIKPKQFARYVPDLFKLNYTNMAEY